MDDLLKEAIADAKAVRETALENAKIALEEAFTPRLKSMLSQKIQNEMEGEEEAGDEMEEAEEAEAEEEPAEEPEMEEAEEAEADEDEIEEAEEADEDEIEEAEGEDDEDEMEEAEDEEDELDLEAILRELEDEADDEVDEEYEASTGDGHDEKGKSADEADLAENDVSSDIGDGDNKVADAAADSSDIGQGSEEPADADSPESGKENEDDEIAEEIDLQEVIAALEEEEDEDEVEETSKYKAEIAEHRNVIKYLRGKLNEVNLLNAKLLFTNKLFRSFGLTNEQKMKVVETFDRAKSLREVKLVFSTLAESFGGGSSVKIKESKGSSSKPVASTEPKRKEVISEGAELKSRFKKLANII